MAGMLVALLVFFLVAMSGGVAVAQGPPIMDSR